MRSLLETLGKDRKAQISVASLSVFGIIIITTAIALAIGAEVLDDVKDQVTDLSGTRINQTFNLENNTVTGLSERTLCGFSAPVIQNFTNMTGTIAMGTNYTLANGSAGSLNWSLGAESLQATSVSEAAYNVSYTFTYGGSACNATLSGLSGVDTFADWLDTVALVLIAVIIIGLLAYFGRAGGAKA